MTELGKTSNILTLQCTLHFSDGQRVSGLIRTSSRRENCPVFYAGAVDRLPYQFEVADGLLLRVLFRSFARELNARFEEELTGEAEMNPDDSPTERAQFRARHHHEPRARLVAL